ncbi:MAG: hypothetical protein CMK92_07850 [Pseudomonas sp.]|jgi:hypothetical protein|nr:hypothetical protein [Pseudomonas sp.]
MSAKSLRRRWPEELAGYIKKPEYDSLQPDFARDLSRMKVRKILREWPRGSEICGLADNVRKYYFA